MDIMIGTLIFQLLILLILIIAPLLSVWGYKDAIRRGRSAGYALAVCMMILFVPVVGFIVYLLIRNT